MLFANLFFKKSTFLMYVQWQRIYNEVQALNSTPSHFPFQADPEILSSLSSLYCTFLKFIQEESFYNRIIIEGNMGLLQGNAY